MSYLADSACELSWSLECSLLLSRGWNMTGSCRGVVGFVRSPGLQLQTVLSLPLNSCNTGTILSCRRTCSFPQGLALVRGAFTSMLSTQVVKFRLHVSDEDHKDRRPPHESLSPLCTSHQVEPADCGVSGSCHVPEDVESSQHNSCVSHSKHLLGVGGRGPWVHSNELCCSTGMRSQATSQGSSNSSWRNPRVLALNALIAQAEVWTRLAAAADLLASQAAWAWVAVS